jgi:hypothetical protein
MEEPMPHTIRIALALSTASLAACTLAQERPFGDPGEDVGTTAHAVITGSTASRPQGLAKITWPASSAVRTGVLVAANKILTGTQDLPTSGTIHVDIGASRYTVVERWSHSQYGITMLRLSANSSEFSWATSSSAPATSSTLECYGFDSAGVVKRVGLSVISQSLTGYTNNFVPDAAFVTGSIGTRDDGVPCQRLGDGYLAGLALSTNTVPEPDQHTQVAAAYFAPWINDPTNKTLTVRHQRVLGETGTLSSSHSTVTTCNGYADGAACNLSFLNATRISITSSTPNVVWTGCSSVTGSTCYVNMNGNKSVRATYVDCGTCFDDCYDGCIEDFGATPTSCNAECDSTCAACD